MYVAKALWQHANHGRSTNSVRGGRNGNLVRLNDPAFLGSQLNQNWIYETMICHGWYWLIHFGKPTFITFFAGASC